MKAAKAKPKFTWHKAVAGAPQASDMGTTARMQSGAEARPGSDTSMTSELTKHIANRRAKL